MDSLGSCRFRKIRLLDRWNIVWYCDHNESDHEVNLEIAGQILSKTAAELLAIANPGPTDIAFLKSAAQNIVEQIRAQHGNLLLSGTIKVFVGRLLAKSGNTAQVERLEEITANP